MPNKNGFVYVYVAKHITNILEKIQSTGKPDKLTITHVKKSWLFKDAKYSAVLELLREMNFLDQSGIPTALYSEYQNPAKSKDAIARGVKNAYPTLFKTYPAAHKLSTDDLDGFIREHTGADKSVVTKIRTTITTLCSIADFGTVRRTEPEKPPLKDHETPGGPSEPVKVSPNLQLNIELHISADMPDEKIESIFKNMRKYLLSNNE
jgi:hypothetical protein